MDSPSATRDGAARALLRRESRALRREVLLPILLGIGALVVTIAGAWLVARLLAALLGHAGAGWPELAAAASLALLGAGLALAQERAQLAAGEAARARLRDAAFARLLEAGPADQSGIGERNAAYVEAYLAAEGMVAHVAELRGGVARRLLYLPVEGRAFLQDLPAATARVAAAEVRFGQALPHRLPVGEAEIFD